MTLHANPSTFQNRHLLPNQVCNSLCLPSLKPSLYDLSLDKKSSHDMSPLVPFVLLLLETVRVAFEV